MKRLKISVFGQGFIGSYLARFFGADMRCHTILCSRAEAAETSEGVSAIKVEDYRDLALYSGDWVGGSDCVIYTAGIAHSKAARSDSDFCRYERVNAELTQDVARACHKAGVKRFIFLSSIKVHDDYQLRNLPITPSSVLNATDPYGVSKIKAERFLAKVGLETGLEVVIVRLPLVIGPGAKGNLLTLMRILNTGLPIPSKGLGDNRRSLLSLENLASAMNVCIDHPSACDQPILLADREPISVAYLIEMINQGLGSPSTLWTMPSLISWLMRMLPSQLQSSLVLSCEESYHQINWEPIVNTSDSLKAMASAYKIQGKIPQSR